MARFSSPKLTFSYDYCTTCIWYVFFFHRINSSILTWKDFFVLNWNIIDIQYHISFKYTSWWFSNLYTFEMLTMISSYHLLPYKVVTVLWTVYPTVFINTCTCQGARECCDHRNTWASGMWSDGTTIACPRFKLSILC